MYLFFETCSVECELKALKAQVLEFEYKIAAELAPKHNEKAREEVKPDTQQQQPGKVIEAPLSSQSQSTDDKKSMVAKPAPNYRESLSSVMTIGGCGLTSPGGFRAAGPKL